MNHKRIAVVGGGAAGLMAAIASAEGGGQVTQFYIMDYKKCLILKTKV